MEYNNLHWSRKKYEEKFAFSVENTAKENLYVKKIPQWEKKSKTKKKKKIKNYSKKNFPSHWRE